MGWERERKGKRRDNGKKREILDQKYIDDRDIWDKQQKKINQRKKEREEE